MKKRSLSSILAFIFSIMLIPSVKADTDDIRTVYSNILNSFTYGNYTNQEQYPTYCIYDIDKNNVPELIIKHGTCEADYQYSFYTYENGNSKYLYTTKGSHTSLVGYPYGNGIITSCHYYRESEYSLITLNNGTINEQTIDPEAYDADNESYLLEYNSDGKKNYVNDPTALNAYFDTHEVSGNIQSSTQAEDISEDQIDQISYCISYGYYCEAINLADYLLNTCNLSDSSKEFLNSCKDLACGLYSEYLDSLNDEVVNSQIEQIEAYINSGMYLEALELCDSVENTDNISSYCKLTVQRLRTEAEQRYNGYLEDVSIQSFVGELQNNINNGYYLEVVNAVNELLSKYDIKENNKETLEYYKSLAQNAYNDYLDYKNKFTTYYISDWGLAFDFYKSKKPKVYSNDYGETHAVWAYCNSDYDCINIYSYRIGEKNSFSGAVINDVNSMVSDYAHAYGFMSFSGFEYGQNYEVLSESDTTVGSFPALRSISKGMGNRNR